MEALAIRNENPRYNKFIPFESRPDIYALGCRLRTLGSTRGDLVTYIDGTLPLLVHVSAPKPELLEDTVECPACAERRRKKAAAQKRWRKGQQS